jgi:SNF2 family DNA or RNA helicase
MQVLEIIMRLRQICCHPILFKAVHKYTVNLTNFEKELRNFVKKRSIDQKDQDNEERYFEPLIEGEEEQRVEIATGTHFSESYLKETINKI